MNTPTRWAFLILIVGLLNLPAGADGKFFLREKVPADVPYQRALLIFDEGTETLVVQSKYDLPDTVAPNSLAWVVPVPSVPELANMELIFTDLFFHRASMLCQPHVRHVSNMISVAIPVAFALVFIAGCLLLLWSLVRYPRLKSGSIAQKGWERRCSVGLALAALGFIVTFATMFNIRQLGGATAEVIKTEQVGIYDVTVIRGDSAEAIVGWLTENGFAFGNEDKAVFADYVARNWCFVTAKVRTDEAIEENRIAAEGMAAPLVLTFATDKPVYPLTLTATAGADTEILLYTFSPNRLTCGDRLRLRHAGQVSAEQVTNLLYVGDTQETARPMESLPDKPMILCKFKGTLTTAQMREDLVLATAPDNTPYRESMWVW